MKSKVIDNNFFFYKITKIKFLSKNIIKVITSITNSNGATVPIRISSNDSWVLLNGSAGTKVVDPDGIDFVGSNYPFTINVEDNTTGSSRTSTITISVYNNSRVTGTAVADQTISITQSA